MQNEDGASQDGIAGFLYFSYPDTAALYEQRAGNGRPGVHFSIGNIERHNFNPGLSKERKMIDRILPACSKKLLYLPGWP
jgi:hypothetical protein